MNGARSLHGSLRRATGSTASRSTTTTSTSSEPAAHTMSEMFNACEYLLDRRVAAGDSDRVALTGAAGELTYAQLLDRVHRTAAVLRELGLQPEQRLLMFMADCPDLVAVYLAAMRIGAVPVPVSTMLH